MTKTRKYDGENAKTYNHESTMKKTRNYENANTRNFMKVWWRKHESTMTKTRKRDDDYIAFSSSCFRVFVIAFSWFRDFLVSRYRHRTFAFSSSCFFYFRHRSFVISCFRVLVVLPSSMHAQQIILIKCILFTDHMIPKASLGLFNNYYE